MDLLLFFFLGASFGSFLGLVVDRFPEESLLFPSSHCTCCGHKLTIRDLIPVISQLMSRSRCRFCDASIPIWYGLFEFACGLGFTSTYLGFMTPSQLFLLIFSATLSLYDLKSQEFPLLIWLIPSLVLLPFGKLSTFTLILLLLGIIAELLDFPMGSGDFLYLSTLAVVLNWQSILWVLEIGSILGICYCLLWKERRIPFLPFLSAGLVLYMICFPLFK